MRLAVYGAVSTLFATFAILSAFRQRSNFYGASVYLSKSNACMMVLCNFGIFCTVIFFKFLQSIFFGKLRSIEMERMHDRLWFTVTETLLALAMFREEFDTTFVVLFISLIFVKAFHWLCSDRVEWMDQSPTPPGRLFHARMMSILSLLWMTDVLLIAYATESVLTSGPTVILMFEMEYMIMFVTCLSIIAKYLVNSYGQYRAQEHWEEKSSYVFYIELATDFLKLLTYIGFLSLTLSFYGLPINVLRDVYYTARSFISKCNNLMRFRQATRNMNERYPNATREEMEALVDKTCIICREDMEFRDNNNPRPANEVQNVGGAGGAGPNDTPKKLPCGHVFHFHCLRSWLERQQTCPTCRRPVLQTQPPTGQTNPAPAAQPPAPALAGQAPGAGGRAAQAPLRPDVQLRVREMQQRLANPSNAMGSDQAPGPNFTDPSASSFQTVRPPPPLQQQATAAPPAPNPLLSFEIPDAPDRTPRRILASTSDLPAGTTSVPNPTPTYGTNLFAGYPNHMTGSTTLGRPQVLTDYEKKKLADRSSVAELARRQEALLQQPLQHQRELQATINSTPLPPTSPIVSPFFDPRPPLLQSNPPNSPHLPRSAGYYYPYQPGPVPPLPPTVNPSPPVSPTHLSSTDADASSPPRDPPPCAPIRTSVTPATTLGLPLNGAFSSLKLGPTSTDIPFPTCERTIASDNWGRKGLSTTHTALPTLIPLFDAASYRVPPAVRRVFAESPGMVANEGVAVDPSVVRLPAKRLENEEVEELIRGSLVEQLDVLLEVQESLRSCADRLRGTLGEGGKGKAKENR
ncbi:hypothetical protein CROQUDRAFT_713679 [Cronartium quercuum f. sp. fusiforme G11]|uniref:RING-type E3 ubiquitin transferase n=1 Tax=Cronartium quercuum f. sp. fusiforme G11 TaxID=708437 RepID=A0A9P6NQ67_9BASI|nr:hypothetical protein CROQUDRAFT_713679 [Cronartium quercuum f. sp. fusiforme G11]